MICSIRSLGIHGIQGNTVTAECYISNGLPGFDVVGLPDAAVKEARERVRAAAKSSGLSFPVGRITVNLAPADTKKDGPVYDLPIAIGILSATDQVKIDKLDEFIMLGELGLDGKLRKINGVLPILISARLDGYKKVIILSFNP